MKQTISAIAASVRGISFALLLSMGVAACSSTGWMPTSGPSRSEVIENKEAVGSVNIQVIDVNAKVASQLLASYRKHSLYDAFGGNLGTRYSYNVGSGDVIEVSIWEAPPASLFNSAVLDPRSGASTSRVTTFQEQMVDSDGNISVPFAGKIRAAGRTLQQIEAEITRLLKGKANQPQVLVRMIRNNTAYVTVVGEVTNSTRMPLTARGERLLDALAAAGGVRQPVNKMTLQVTRGDQVVSLPLDVIISDPKQNIVLKSGDVVTSLYQPLSFSVLGATGKNEELNFEAKGISLAQALARAGGVQDNRADAKGVFIFRFESPQALGLQNDPTQQTAEGKIPVVYRFDLKNPATFFVSQNFMMQDKDVMYVSNASAAETQKFLNLMMSIVYPALTAVGLKSAF